MEVTPQVDDVYHRFISVMPRRLKYTVEEFRYAFGLGFSQLLRNRVPLESQGAQFMLVKHVSPMGVEHFFEMIPDGKLILLVRDGRDNISSLLGAEFRKKRGRWLRPDITYRYATKWRDRALMIKNALTKLGSKALLVRYEDLVKDECKELLRIGEHLEMDFDEEILSRARELSVQGSSFAPEDGERAVWRERPKTPEFKPVGRWKDKLSPLEARMCLRIIREPMEFFYPEANLDE